MARVDLPEPYSIRQARQSIRDSNVLPPFSASDTAHGLETHSRHGGQFGQRAVAAGADEQNVFLGEFGVGVPFSRRVPISANHVSHVFSLGSQSEVRGLHARRTVARVQNKKTVWNFAIMSPVRSPRGDYVAFPGRQDSISVSVDRSRPVPASVQGRWSWHVPGKRLSFSLASGPVSLERAARAPGPAPTSVVAVAPSTPSRRLVARFYAAGGDCHR